MEENSTTVTVNILDKEYQVSCPKDEVDSLTKSAAYLDEKMKAIRDSGNVLGLDRIAVMSALNIANELMRDQKKIGAVEDIYNQKISALADKIDAAISKVK